MGTSRFNSNALTNARPEVAALHTGRGALVALRATGDRSSGLVRIATVLERAGLSGTLARQIARDGVTPDQARAYASLFSADFSRHLL
jgi:hypothetical protein